jgi:hypothetical protein
MVSLCQETVVIKPAAAACPNRSSTLAITSLRCVKLPPAVALYQPVYVT